MPALVLPKKHPLCLVAIVVAVLVSRAQAVEQNSGSPAAVGAELELMGCFVDDRNRAFYNGLARVGSNERTVSACANRCRFFKYMAIAHGDACFCGDTFKTDPPYVKVDDSSCNMNDKCTIEYGCGSSWRNSIYRLPQAPVQPSVFVSKNKHMGDFSDLAGGPSEFCNSEAAAAGLAGDWCAILGTSSTAVSMACSFEYPLFMVGGGEKVTEDLFGDQAVVNRDEYGNEVQGDFWSGAGRTCDDWTAGAGVKAEIGRVNPDGRIQFRIYNKPCDMALPVVCVKTSVSPTVFVSSKKHVGDFSDFEGGASDFCNSEAVSAGLPGDWCAMLGTSTTKVSRACAFQYPLVMVGGEKVTKNIFRDRAVMNRDEYGNEVQGDFWSGSGRTCDDWTAGAGVNAEIGRVNPDGRIQFRIYNKPCDMALPVVCVRPPPFGQVQPFDCGAHKDVAIESLWHGDAIVFNEVGSHGVSTEMFHLDLRGARVNHERSGGVAISPVDHKMYAQFWHHRRGYLLRFDALGNMEWLLGLKEHVSGASFDAAGNYIAFGRGLMVVERPDLLKVQKKIPFGPASIGREMLPGQGQNIVERDLDGSGVQEWAVGMSGKRVIAVRIVDGKACYADTKLIGRPRHFGSAWHMGGDLYYREDRGLGIVRVDLEDGGCQTRGTLRAHAEYVDKGGKARWNEGLHCPNAGPPSFAWKPTATTTGTSTSSVTTQTTTTSRTTTLTATTATVTQTSATSTTTTTTTTTTPTADIKWVLAEEGATCDAACAHERGCSQGALDSINSPASVLAAAQNAGHQCQTQRGWKTMGWRYRNTPGICTNKGCCGDGSCTGLCVYKWKEERSCSGRPSGHYSRLCPCNLAPLHKVYRPHYNALAVAPNADAYPVMCCWSSTDRTPGPPAEFNVYAPGAQCSDTYKDANFPAVTSFAHDGQSFSPGRYFRNREEGCFTLPWVAANAFCVARGARMCTESEKLCLPNAGCNKWNHFWLADAAPASNQLPILPARCMNGCAVTGGDYVTIGAPLTTSDKEGCIALCSQDANCMASQWHQTSQECKLFANSNMPIDQDCGSGTGVTWQPGGDELALKYYTCIKGTVTATRRLSSVTTNSSVTASSTTTTTTTTASEITLVATPSTTTLTTTDDIIPYWANVRVYAGVVEVEVANAPAAAILVQTSPASAEALESALTHCVDNVVLQAVRVLDSKRVELAFEATTDTLSKSESTRCLLNEFVPLVIATVPGLNAEDCTRVQINQPELLENEVPVSVDNGEGLVEGLWSDAGNRWWMIAVAVVIAVPVLSMLVTVLVCLCKARRHHRKKGHKNDEGAPVHRVAKGTVYCGGYWDDNEFGSKTGYCGPSRGPQCLSCQRFQQAWDTRATEEEGRA